MNMVKAYDPKHICKAIYPAKFDIFLSYINKYVVCLFERYLFPFVSVGINAKKVELCASTGFKITAKLNSLKPY